MAVRVEIHGKHHTFADHEALLAFIAEEEKFWQWLKQSGVGRVANYYAQRFSELTQWVITHRDRNDALHVSTEHVSHAFNSDNPIYSGGPTGQRVDSICRRYGVRPGAIAYGLARGEAVMEHVSSRADLEAAVAFAFPAMEPANDVIAEVTAERRRIRSELTKAERFVRELESATATTMAAEHASWLARQELALSGLAAMFNGIHAAWVTDFEQAKADVAAAMASMKATEAQYKIHMQMRAPVRYWKAKSRLHKLHERALKCWVITYFAVTIPSVMIAFGLTGGWLLGIAEAGGKVDSPMYVVAGAGLAAVTTLVFWGGRLLTRFYLSQNHLHHDAADRAVMTKTFLALTAVDPAAENDRAIILAALFRPNADGIVKDDGAPDLGPASVAAKILSGRPT